VRTEGFMHVTRKPLASADLNRPECVLQRLAGSAGWSQAILYLRLDISNIHLLCLSYQPS
jgi:hypothetical protein